MERLKDLVSQADHAVSTLEARQEGPAGRDPERTAEELRRAMDQVWAAAARYLRVVDGIDTEAPRDVVRAARHTGLLGDDEAKDAERLLAARDQDPTGRTLLEAAPTHLRFLRLWLERVRDTAAKAHEGSAADEAL